MIELQAKPVQTTLEILSSQHTIAIHVECRKGISCVHASGLETCRNTASSDTVLQQMMLVRRDEHLSQRCRGRILLLPSPVAPNLVEEVGSLLTTVVLESSKEQVEILGHVVHLTVNETVANLSRGVLECLCRFIASTGVDHCLTGTEGNYGVLSGHKWHT